MSCAVVYGRALARAGLRLNQLNFEPTPVNDLNRFEVGRCGRIRDNLASSEAGDFDTHTIRTLANNSGLHEYDSRSPRKTHRRLNGTQSSLLNC